MGTLKEKSLPSLCRHFKFGSCALVFFLGISLMRASTADAATTQVRFFDDCTGEPLTLGTPNGVRVEVEIQGLTEEKDHREPVLLDLTVAFVEPGVTSPKPIVLQKKKKYWPKDGQILIRKRMDLKNAQILQVQALWTHDNQLGHGVGTLLMPGTSVEPYYKRVSEASCTWESPSQIDSGHYLNSSQDIMSLKKTFGWNQMRGGQKGRTEGPPAITGDGDLRFGTPLVKPEPLLGGVPLGGISVWLFRGRDKFQSKEDFSTIEREWFLEPGQGGFLASRWLFSRYRAEEYVLRRMSSHRSCWQWTMARQGYLDVGAPKVDFYVVPESDSYDLKKAEAAINRIEPILNTCESDFLKREGGKFNFINPVETSSQEMLFFNADEKLEE